MKTNNLEDIALDYLSNVSTVHAYCTRICWIKQLLETCVRPDRREIMILGRIYLVSKEVYLHPFNCETEVSYNSIGALTAAKIIANIIALSLLLSWHYIQTSGGRNFE